VPKGFSDCLEWAKRQFASFFHVSAPKTQCRMKHRRSNGRSKLAVHHLSDSHLTAPLFYPFTAAIGPGIEKKGATKSNTKRDEISSLITQKPASSHTMRHHVLCPSPLSLPSQSSASSPFPLPSPLAILCFILLVPSLSRSGRGAGAAEAAPRGQHRR